MIFPHFFVQRWKNGETRCILDTVDSVFTVNQQEIF